MRNDSDGDGLSDDWESANGRDPSDGKLLFTFDCGGWQTEGWQGDEILGNIAGRQGFLDFVVPNGTGTLMRSGLKLDASRNAGRFVMTVRADNKTTVEVLVDFKDSEQQTRLSAIAIPASQEFSRQTISLPVDQSWQGTIESIQINWTSTPGTGIEIDAMEITE